MAPLSSFPGRKKSGKPGKKFGNGSSSKSPRSKPRSSGSTLSKGSGSGQIESRTARSRSTRPGSDAAARSRPQSAAKSPRKDARSSRPLRSERGFNTTRPERNERANRAPAPEKRERRTPELKERQERRYRSFSVPPLPIDITGEELDKRRRSELRPLAPENAEVVAKHLVAITRFLEIEPDLAYRHGQEATYRAGRIGLVREFAGLAALRSGRNDVAAKDLRAAQRITGSKDLLAYIAQAEVALGHPRKALEIAGSVAQAELSEAGRVEMRIAAAAARSALGQFDAAVVTLRCRELNQIDAVWSERLRSAYLAALRSAGNFAEAEEFEQKVSQPRR